MNEWMYLIPINRKTDGAQKKAQGTNSSDTKKKQTNQSETDVDYCCKTLANGWVLTDELYRSIYDRIAPTSGPTSQNLHQGW